MSDEHSAGMSGAAGAPPEKSALELIREELYAPEAPLSVELPTLSIHDEAPAHGWNDEKVQPVKLSWALYFLLGALGVFIFASAITAVLLIHGSRSISADRIDVVVNGATTIASGDTVTLIISIKNNNPTSITDTNFTVDLPPGSREPSATSTPFDHYTDTLGTLAPGATATRTVTAVMFGKENQHLSIPLHLEYRASGSDAIFVKDKDYALTVSTSPISVEVSAPSQSASGQPVTVAVRVRSNAQSPLPNVAILGSYPSGFTVTNTNPQASAGGTYFALGTLAPGQERDLTVTGTLSGVEGDAPAFRFTAGTAASGGALNVTYTDASAQVALAKPLVAVTLSLNHNSGTGNVTVPPGQPIDGIASWVNSLSSAIQNARITVHFSGSAFDPAGVQTNGGFYQSSTGDLIFSSQTNPSLAQLSSGESGNGSFTITPKPLSSLRGIAQPSITATVSVSGIASGESTSVSSTLTRTILLRTALTLSARAFHTGAPFQNIGPLPPKANTETDYTIALSAGSSVNTVGGGTVTLQLPSYVRFTGQTSPGSSSITYDDTTRTVTWSLEQMTPGQNQAAAFQVAFLPSSAQNGTTPTLAQSILLSGTDLFTKEQVHANANDVSTDIQTDSAYRPGYGTVAQ